MEPTTTAQNNIRGINRVVKVVIIKINTTIALIQFRFPFLTFPTARTWTRRMRTLIVAGKFFQWDQSGTFCCVFEGKKFLIAIQNHFANKFNFVFDNFYIFYFILSFINISLFALWFWSFLVFLLCLRYTIYCICSFLLRESIKKKYCFLIFKNVFFWANEKKLEIVGWWRPDSLKANIRSQFTVDADVKTENINLECVCSCSQFETAKGCKY